MAHTVESSCITALREPRATITEVMYAIAGFAVILHAIATDIDRDEDVY